MRQPNQSSSQVEPSRRRAPRHAVRDLGQLLGIVAVATATILLLQAFVVKPYRIPSASMAPTLAVGQRILVNRLDTNPQLGDIVVFHPPVGAIAPSPLCGNPEQGVDRAAGINHPQPCDVPTPHESSQTFVKRVVGLPGDHLLIEHGRVWRNGVEERGPYVRGCRSTLGCTFFLSIHVPPGDYYLMGDNRADSDDSRFWGPVPRRWLIGVALATYWPPDRIGFF